MGNNIDKLVNIFLIAVLVLAIPAVLFVGTVLVYLLGVGWGIIPAPQVVK